MKNWIRKNLLDLRFLPLENIPKILMNIILVLAMLQTLVRIVKINTSLFIIKQGIIMLINKILA